MKMTEYISRTTKNSYKIIFETDSFENYREIEEAVRKIIDRNNATSVTPLSRRTCRL